MLEHAERHDRTFFLKQGECVDLIVTLLHELETLHLCIVSQEQHARVVLVIVLELNDSSGRFNFHFFVNPELSIG